MSTCRRVPAKSKGGIMMNLMPATARLSCFAAWVSQFHVTNNRKELTMNHIKLGRRTLLRSSLAAAAAVPLGAIPLTLKAAEKLEESDPSAAALGYKHDTADVDAGQYPRHSADQMCKNCQLYQHVDGDWGNCGIFPAKQVNVKGWCNAWVKKAD